MKKLFISFAAALLLASCGGNGNNQSASNKTTDNNPAPKQETKADTAIKPAAIDTVAAQPTTAKSPDIYVAVSKFTNSNNFEETTIYKNDEILYKECCGGRVDFLYAIGGHVFYGIYKDYTNRACEIYVDGEFKTQVPEGFHVWKGDKDIFIDDGNGKIIDQNEKTVFEYTADEEGATSVNAVLQHGGDIYVLMNTGFGTEASKLFKNGKEIKNTTGVSECYGLCYSNGDVYFRGFGYINEQMNAPVICKNMEPVLSNFKPEGSFWIINGDVYHSEPYDGVSDDGKSYINIFKNGKNPKKVKGFPESYCLMDANGSDIYYWYVDGLMEVHVCAYKNFEETAEYKFKSNEPENGGMQPISVKPKNGQLYVATVDYSQPDTVTIHKDADILRAYPAHLFFNEEEDYVEVHFCMDIE